MKHLNQMLLLGCLSAILAGCGSAPSHFYTLSPAAVGDGKSQANYAVAVGPVSVPAEVNRPQMTVQISPNQVEVDEFHRWAAPLNENIARVVAADLAKLLGTPRVAAVPPANFAPDWRVSVDIQKFCSVPGKMVRIDALWVVSKIGGNVSYSGRTVAAENVAAGNFDALAAAHSRALAKVSADIAAAIRAAAAENP